MCRAAVNTRYNDYCRFVGSSPNAFLSCNLGTSSGFSSNQYGFNSKTGVDQGYSSFRQLADVNGDGSADYCRFVGSSPNVFLSCNLASATGFSSSQHGFNSVKGIDQGYSGFRQLVDVNGDGRADYCRFVGSSPNIFLSCNLANLTGFSLSQYGFNSIKGIDQGYSSFRELADVNGDGRADYCRFVGRSPNIFLSCNLASSTGFALSQYGFNSAGGIDQGDNSFREMADVNGDGRADFCRLMGNAPFIFPSCDLAGGQSFSGGQENYAPLKNADLGYDYFRKMADVNGDNKADYCRFVGSSPNIFLSCNLMD